MTKAMTSLTEARPRLLAESTDTPGRYRVQLISPGWGSSGFYSADVLSEAATKGVFPAGLHMYADHPTMTDEVERPGRSVRDLWGVLDTPATVDPATGALVAEARVFTPYRPLLEEMADAIGLSIRAGGYAETGEADGREGPIITELTEALSVDFVTAAGRGGKMLELIESAVVAPKTDVAEALPGGMTANDLRDALCAAVSDAYGGEGKYAWVRDYTDEVVIYELDGNVADRGSFRQSFTVDGSTVTLSDDQQPVVAKTTWEPVNEAGPGSTPPPAGTTGATDPGPNAGTGTSKIEENTMTGTPGAGDTPRTPRDVYEAEIEQLKRSNAQLLARDRGRTVVGRIMAESFLAPATMARLTEELLGESLPLNDELKLDEERLTELAVAARERGEIEHAQALEAAGYGRPRGLGDLAPQSEAAGPTKLEEQLEQTFGAIGLSESAAKTAAKGRC